MRNWKNWEAHVESILFPEATHYPKFRGNTKIGPALEVAVTRHQGCYGIEIMRAFQRHSGGKHINPTLHDNVLLLDNFAEHIYHVESSRDTHWTIQSGLFPCGKDVKKGSVLSGRESNVHRSLSIEGSRRDEAQDCSVQTHLEKTLKHSVLV